MSSPKLKGKLPPVAFTSTGLYSLDRALKGQLRVPSIIELYGMTHVGKSSLAYYLAGKIREDGVIYLADFEHFDSEYLLGAVELAGFKGDIEVAEIIDGEQVLTDLRDRLMDTDFQAAILDSVGAVVFESEIEAERVDTKERLGVRPKLFGKMMRLATYSLKRNAACLILINHLHPIITLGRGMTTSGGVAIHNLSSVRLRLKVETHHDDYNIVLGKVDKLRWGGKGAHFKFVTLPGLGVHSGMSAVVDCIWLGMAEKTRQGRVNMDDKKYGYLSELARKAADGEEEIFDDFKKKLWPGAHAGSLIAEES